MADEHEEQPVAKRQRLDHDSAASEAPDCATPAVQAAPAAETTVAPAASTDSAEPETLVQSFFKSDATGLFGVLAGSIGKRAAHEDEVGITEYVTPDVQPFAGIIKHR